MKKICSLALALLLTLGLFACAKAPGYTIDVLTSGEELAERTGIELIIPESAENVSWLLLTDADGNSFPQVNFTLYDADWHYRAQVTDQTEPYNFSDLDYKWTDEASWGSDDRVGPVFCCDKGGWIGWLENGVAYNVFSEVSDWSVYCDVAGDIYTAESWAHDDPEPYDPSGDVTVTEVTGFELFPYVWKYDDEDSYIRISNSRCYVTAGADLAPTSPYCLCEMKDGSEDTLILYDQDGKQVQTLTAKKDANFSETHLVTLTDGDGRTLSLPDETGTGMGFPALDGTYNCYFNQSYLQDGTFYLMEMVDPWYPAEEAESLAVGSTLELHDYFNSTITVETLEKQADGSLKINDTCLLTPVEGSTMWRLTGHGMQSMALAGSAEVTGDTRFTDNTDSGFKTLDECLATTAVYGAVTVKGGKVLSITVTSIF